MNTDRINLPLCLRCRGQFVGVFAADHLPAFLPSKSPLLLVCNTDNHDRAGRYWVDISVERDSSRGEYFDSLNQPPPAIFKNYVDSPLTLCIKNGRQLQRAALRFCGHYCVFYCLFKV